MTKFAIPEGGRSVPLLSPAADAAGRTSRYISLKDAARVIVLCQVNQGNAATVALSLLQATAVAGTGSKAGPSVPVYSALDVATSDVMVRRTDGASYTTDAGLKEKIVSFHIDAAALDVNGGFDCIAVSTGASSASNLTSAVAILVGNRFQSASPPSAIVD